MMRRTILITAALAAAGAAQAHRHADMQWTLGDDGTGAAWLALGVDNASAAGRRA